MRIAILSDIHGNLEALEQVLEDLDRQRPDSVVCLGDNVGYGPNPEEVLNIVRERRMPCVMGNHELGVVDAQYLGWFNPLARTSLLITRQLLSSGSLEYIRDLKPFLIHEEGLFVHGCPPDSVTRYLFEVSNRAMAGLFQRMTQAVCFVGHTHDLELVTFDGARIRRIALGEGVVQLAEGCRHIVNVGSVGQPRDGNNNAKYVIWNVSANSVEIRFLPYDIPRTAEKILRLGFPEINALRLF
ncbi:metallophosphoesterase family protein [Syntrophobacter fumaroxidans]|uniref:Metallophosphoesterase n=1 Tax=Syntrophobacter fumaroxidans (strain DSM 10017 / MPOB) TaxID=335543 RepID=A0LLU4_SYNFM|nr:metallophosphoesterase family protein [Syntrophobacter fumaroxidans]ABK18396.1 metallophosphoesterase [Syntrophobacter fumaroxidans MPOB]